MYLLSCRPFEAETLPALFVCINRGAYKPIPAAYPPSLHKLVGQVLKQYPGQVMHLSEFILYTWM